MKKLILCLICAVSIVSAQKSYTYKFQDAAMGPEYSRSYQIDVSKTNVHFIVFGADKNLIDENRAINKYQYKAFVAGITECYLTKKSSTSNDGCTGGTSEIFTITYGAKVVDGTVNHCGGTDSGDLKGDTERAAKLFRDMVPGFDYKLSTTKAK